MKRRLRRQLKKQFKALIKRPSSWLYLGVGLLCIGVIGYAVYMDTRHLSVDPASYRPLLDLIGQVESNDNYNAHFGNSANTDTKFTAMSIEEVQHWQQEFIAAGNASSAVGRYQIIDSTLSGLVQELDLDTSEKFDAETQDKLAVALLERRGSEAYVNQELRPEEFAANLAKEWAALPKVIGNNSDKSYYDGDGLNSALVEKGEVLRAVKHVSPE